MQPLQLQVLKLGSVRALLRRGWREKDQQVPLGEKRCWTKSGWGRLGPAEAQGGRLTVPVWCLWLGGLGQLVLGTRWK